MSAPYLRPHRIELNERFDRPETASLLQYEIVADVRDGSIPLIKSARRRAIP
jgi:hypothetical protein